jgi:predicted TIM-barrel fold metal-dependent hydrolase
VSHTKIPIVDTDVHPAMNPAVPGVMAYLPDRWRDYVTEIGVMRGFMTGGERPRHREFASRWDATPPEGGAPGSNPEFAREQLLDQFDMSGAMLNDIAPIFLNGGKQQPAQLAAAFCAAVNDHRRDEWLASDPRWYASINTPYELPALAVEEIRRCKEDPEFGDRWKQIMFAPDNARPPGHPTYWPIYEAAEHYGLPIGFHVLASRKLTSSGSCNFYFEEHCDWAAFNFPLVSSLVFEGVFDRFPKLKIALIELSWSWAVPLAWRMDRAYRVMRSEVGHLQRLPSEYIRDHIWYSTQPIEEPEEPRFVDDILDLFEASGMADKLMYSSDYPHWDYDPPSSFPASVTGDRLRRILGENAAALYGIDLLPGTGWTPEPAVVAAA